MSKVTLLDLSSAIASSIISAVNTNNIALRAALDNTLSRDGTTPNQMQATLDMNSNTIINLPAAIGATEPVRKFEFDALSVSMTTSTAAAAASATAAAASAVAAAASAASASTTLVNFNNTYLGVFASAPSVNNTGGGLINGNLYFNSTILAFQIYNTGIWYTGVSSNVTSAANSIKGNNTGSTAAAIDLTPAQVSTMINSTVAPVFSNITGKPTTLGGYGITDGQPLDSDLTALAAMSATGIAVQTAVGTWAQRTITGTANEITLTNGIGVSGNPTVSIPSAVTFTGKTITGGAYSAVTGLGIRSTGTGAFDLTLASAENLTAGRTLTVALNDVARTLTIAGNATVSGTSSGTNTGDQTITLTNDVTGTGTGSFATTIAAGAVTLAKQANLAANSIIGNNTGSASVPLALTAAQVKTLLAVSLTSDVTGTLQAAQFPALTGDVTTSAGALGTTIASGAVTLAKQANLAANSIQGNNTGSAATPIALTAAQVKTLLAVSLTSDVTGVLQAAQEPAHTGDVTNTAGSLALTIASGVVTNAKAATMAANTIKINNTAGVAAPIDGTVAQTKTLLAISTSDVSGLAAVASSGSAADLSTGTLLAARMPALTGDVTSTVNTVSTTIAANAVTNAKAAQMAANTFKGNNTGSTANSIDLTVTQATAMLNNVVGDAGSGGTKGLVPAPAAGDAVALKFLKADGTWATPNAGVGSPGGTNGQIQYNNSALFGGFTASGDIAIVTSTGVATIQANVVDNTKIRQGGAASVIGNSTSSTANVADISAASDNTMLGRASGTLSFRKIVDADHTTNTITSASLAQMAANTFKGNNTASTANASDLTVDQMQVALNIHSFTTARWLGMN